MSWYDNMQSRLVAQGGSIAGSQTLSTKNAIINSFKDSPSYRSVLINGVATDVRLTAGKETNFKVMSNSNFKTMILLPEVTVNIGDVVTIDAEYWLVTDFMFNDIYPTCQLQKSNHLLKWQNDYYQIKTARSVVTNRYDFIDEGKHITIPDGTYYIIISSNADTLLIKINDRFLINNSAFKITHIDSVTNVGLLKLTASEEIIKDVDINGIADYESGTYSIVVNNGVNLNLGLNQEIQLDVRVKYGNHILDAPVTYYNHNSEVVSVNANGLLTALLSGTSIVDVRSLGITMPINIKVVDEIIIDNYSIAIEGMLQINKGAVINYINNMFNNGVLIDSLPCTWSLNNTNASIVSQDINGCNIIGNIEGSSVTLTCTLNSDPTIYKTITIQIKGLW